LTLANGQTLGDEIVLSYPSGSLTNFSIEIYSPNATFSGSVSMDVSLLPNTGGPFNGYPTPNTATPLYDSGAFALSTPRSFAGTVVGTIAFNLSARPVTVTNDFTVAVKVTGLTGADSVGVELFDPATVGANYGDYWLNNGSWGLYTQSQPTAFGTELQGVITPKPFTLKVGAITNHQVSLSWTNNGATYTLQQTYSLNSPVLWTNVSIVPSLANGNFMLAMPTTNKITFFRVEAQ
jgi:hypothetical protein